MARTRQKLQAEIIPFLRGQVSVYRRFVGTVQDDEKMLRFVNSIDGPRLAALGTSCPDHFLRTKIKPLFVELGSGERRYRQPENGRSRTGWSSIERTTRLITTAANGPIRRRCAIRIRPSCLFPAWE